MFRAFARFGAAVSLALAALAALGFDWLRRQPSIAARTTAVTLCGLVLFELAPWPPWRWRDVLPTSAHRWLSEQPPPIRVLDCTKITDPADIVARHLFDHQIGVRLEEDCWRRDIGGWSAARGYTHVLIRSGTRVEDRWGGPPAGLEPRGDFDDANLFAVVGPPAALSAEIATGFHRAEIQGERSFRWMSESGTLLLLNTSEAPIDATLELELHAFPRGRTVDATLDGHPLAALGVDPEPRVQPVGPLRLEPGQHVLGLRSREQVQTADDLLGNGDQRRLSVALWGWHWQLSPDQSPE